MLWEPLPRRHLRPDFPLPWTSPSRARRCRMTTFRRRLCPVINEYAGWKAIGCLRFRGWHLTAELDRLFQSRAASSALCFSGKWDTLSHITLSTPPQPQSLGTEFPVPSHLHGDSTGELRGDGARAGNSEGLTCFEAKTPQTLKPWDTLNSPQDTTRNGSKRYETKFIKTFYKSDFVIQVSTYIYTYLQVGHSVFSFSGRFFLPIYTNVLFFSTEGLNCITDTKVKQSWEV